MTNPEPSHIAYADESRYNVGRFRGVGLVTVPAETERGFIDEILNLLTQSDVRELSWKNLKGARERFAALKLIDCVIQHACSGQLRIDVLIWDTWDSRHKIQGRDDIANLERMYYHLFKNTLKKRWPRGSTWLLKPDENSAINWVTLQECLQASSGRIMLIGPLSKEQERLGRIRLDFNVLEIRPSVSSEEPLIQLADLFVGMAVFSHERFISYLRWKALKTGQYALLPSLLGSLQLSKSDKQRCPVLDEFNTKCKRRKMGVSLQSKRGLCTFNPNNPLNFWLYEPQHEQDRAPTRQ